MRVDAATPGALRPFEAVRDTVLADWRREEERKLNAAYLAALLGKYPVAAEPGIDPVVDGALRLLGVGK